MLSRWAVSTGAPSSSSSSAVAGAFAFESLSSFSKASRSKAVFFLLDFFFFLISEKSRSSEVIMGPVVSVGAVMGVEVPESSPYEIAVRQMVRYDKNAA